MQKAYLYYAAGQAVAAVHLGLKVKQVSADPLLASTDIVLSRDDVKARVTLWLTGTAVERKLAGRASPLRRMRNRERIKVELTALMEQQSGPSAKRRREAMRIFTQAQDRANAITTYLLHAAQLVADKLEAEGTVSGDYVERVVKLEKIRQRSQNNPESTPDQPATPDA